MNDSNFMYLLVAILVIFTAFYAPVTLFLLKEHWRIKRELDAERKNVLELLVANIELESIHSQLKLKKLPKGSSLQFDSSVEQAQQQSNSTT